VMSMLSEIVQAGATVVMVTHSHAHAGYARRTLNLLDGQIVAASLRAA
jgi:putative ABC transport system ATP-binding protein